MALRERLLMAGGLVLGLSAVGCGDGDGGGASEDGGDIEMDSSTPGSDGGAMDASGTSDASRDSGVKLPTTMCGSNSCEGNLINNRVVDPCCVPDGDGKATDTCGFDADDIKNANPASPFTGCVPRDVMRASASQYCSEFWDQVEPDGTDNDGLDIRSGSLRLVFDGCCLPTGECGAQIDSPRGQPEINSHLGCVSFTRLNEALNGADAGMTKQPDFLPFCNASNGAPLTGTATVPGQPKFVCGCGEGKLDDGTGTFPCFNNLPTTVCGAADPTDAQLAMVPEFICGCPSDPTKARLPCLINLPETTCGTKQIDANSAELDKIPVFICGEDPTTPLPSLKGVDKAVCGKKAAEASDLAAVPEFICGETGASPANPLPKLRNIVSTTCGGLQVTTGNPYLALIPEFICGAVGLTSAPSLPVMPNVEKEVCGAKQIDANSVELGLIPEFICGVDVANPTVLPTLNGVDPAVCGKKPIDANSVELTNVPEFICGATGATAQTAGLPRLANVEFAVCGKKQIDGTSVELALIPTFICGADGGTFIGLPQLLGVANSVCGMKVMTADSVELTNVPEFLCGQVGSTDASPLPKLAGVAANICGKEAVDATSPRLAGVPKFICGCESNTALELGCMRNVEGTVCGAAPPSAGLLSQVPEFICGCGTTTKDQALGSLCMSFVDNATCGTLNTTVSVRPELGNTPCLVGVPEYAVGCGDGAATGAITPCLRGAGTAANPSAQLPGCVNVAADYAGLRRLPEYLCGCGETATNASARGDAVLPCLPFTAENACGKLPISASQQLPAAFTSNLCGCGNDVTTTAAACLDNVPGSICGTTAVCILGQTGAAANCNNGGAPNCADLRGGAGAGAGGAGGAGDGVGDTCVP